jgi:uncharacterized membrane protein HdeD (DUF308 family)
MKLKINSVLSFSLTLLLALSIGFIIHIAILKNLNLPLFKNKIIPAYLVNYLLAIGIFKLIYFLNEKKENFIGFIYLGSSFLKLILFFLLFYPSYKEDGIITKLESFSFLTPYFLCLTIETYALVKIMNNNE